MFPGANSPREVVDIIYAHRESGDLPLDFYYPIDPQQKKPYPVIVWIHGGAFRSGSKTAVFFDPVFAVERGYVVASIEYRFAPKHTFPGQIYDCKEAVRWLRAYAAEYNLATEKIGVWGESAGAYLATFLGVTGGLAEFEGLGENKNFSSSIQAVAHFYGPTNFGQFPQDYLANEDVPEVQLLGGFGPHLADLMKKSNPLNYIAKGNPPFFILHGMYDAYIPYNQSVILHEALMKNGVTSEMHLIKANHGGYDNESIYTPENIRLTLDFFDKNLK